jgi:alpha-1,2-mannosyltransferase
MSAWQYSVTLGLSGPTEEHVARTDKILSPLEGLLHVRSVRVALWILGAGSAGFTLGRALSRAVSIHQVDFEVYLMGSRQVFKGHLYSTYLAFPKEPFTYPPVAALLFIPFTLVGRTAAQVVWAVVSAVSLIGFLGCSLKVIGPAWRTSEVILWSLILAFPAMVLNPIGLTFSYGQINILLALLVLADLTGKLTVKGHTIPRGIMTGIAAALKVTPLIFVPFLFLTKEIRAGRAASIAFLACGVGMTVIAPSESWSYWTRYIFDAHRVGGAVYISNQSLRSAIIRFSHAHAPESLIVLSVLVVGIVGLSVAVWAYRSSSVLLGVLVCAVTGLIVSPITWAHHLVWIIPVVLWLAFGHDRPAFGRIWAVIATLWFWYGAIWRIPYGNGAELHDSVTQMLLGNSYSLAMVLFVGGVAAMLMLRRIRTRVHSKGDVGAQRSSHRPGDSPVLPSRAAPGIDPISVGPAEGR